MDFAPLDLLARLATLRERPAGLLSTPEAQLGGPIALVRDGDAIVIDAIEKRLDVDVDEDEFARRRAEWQAPPLKATRGTLHKYIRTVKSASEGCVTDE